MGLPRLNVQRIEAQNRGANGNIINKNKKRNHLATLNKGNICKTIYGTVTDTFIHCSLIFVKLHLSVT